MKVTLESGTEMELSDSIKWRGSTYILEKVEDDNVHWYNPVSRHRAYCTIYSWEHDKDPYGGKYGWAK